MPSSVVRAMRYNERTLALTITFRASGETYRYFNVPAWEWEAFRTAPSKGTYLNTVFKERGYGYRRVAGKGDMEPR